MKRTKANGHMLRWLTGAVTGSMALVGAGCGSDEGGSSGRSSAALAAPASSGPIVGIGGKCLDDSGDGTDDGNKIQLWDCNGTPAQQWASVGQTLVGPGNKCLDVRFDNQSQGTVAQLWTCNGTEAQNWTFLGSTIVSAGGLCLDVSDSSTVNGTQVQIWDCNGTSAQQWSSASASGGAGAGGSGSDPCAGQTCGGHGTCASSTGTAACTCDPGYTAEGTQCVAAPAAPPASGTGQFHIANGQIIDPNGNTFIAKGINASNPVDTTQASEMVAFFPKLNFVRLPAPSGADPSQLPDPSSLAPFVDYLTSRNIVVEIEDHPWPQPNPYTGDQLTTETSWYASVAAYYQSNPYVWLGTMNEPESGDDGIMQAQVDATVAAIRGAGSNALIMIEAGVGGGNPNTVGDGGGYSGPGSGYTASHFTSFTNVLWDLHYYPYLVNYSTDIPTITATLLGSASSHSGVAGTQTITSADGVMPVILGEVGCSDSNNPSPDWAFLDFVFNNSYVNGAAAWAWYPGYLGPGASQGDFIANLDVTDGNGNLTDYGNALAGDM